MIALPEVRILSLLPPWGSAIAWRLKHWETRSWKTPYRGLVVIHASSAWNAEGRRAMTGDPILRATLREAVDKPELFPLGRCLALCRLTDCVRTEELAPTLKPSELCWGNYEPGRWAWKLEEVKPLHQGELKRPGKLGLTRLSADEIRAILPGMFDRFSDPVEDNDR